MGNAVSRLIAKISIFLKIEKMATRIEEDKINGNFMIWRKILMSWTPYPILPRMFCDRPRSD